MTAPTVPAADTTAGTTAPAVEVASPEPVVAQDLLVEDVSIDGMCGVY